MRVERGRDHERDAGQLAAYAATFVARHDMYPVQLADGRYITVREPLTLARVADHLRGAVTLGAYALDSDSVAHWLCFDADDAADWAGLRRMAATLCDAGVAPYLEPSRRGGHLWLFVAPMPGAAARRLGQQLLREHGLAHVELFPKQDRLRTGPGSLVRLPLGRHRRTGRRYPFITVDGQPLAPTVRAQVAVLSAPARVPPDFVDAVRARTPQPEAVAPPLHPAPVPDAAEGGRLSDRIKAAISVYDYVSMYVALDARNMAHCPFHDDAHKSFSVDPVANFWHCFAGCGGGSVIDFEMKRRAMRGEDPSFVATVTDLAHRLFPR